MISEWRMQSGVAGIPCPPYHARPRAITHQCDEPAHIEVESYGESGGPLLVILSNKILALNDNHINHANRFRRSLTHPGQHIINSTEGCGATNELVLFIFLDYSGVAGQVLDGAR